MQEDANLLLGLTAENSFEPWRIPHDPRASLQDLFYCFRLLLGRSPHPQEWTGHSLRAGEDLAQVVASYVNSLEFSRRGLLDRDYASRVELVEIEGFRLYVPTDDLDVGRYVRRGQYEPHVTTVFRRLLQPGMSVVDLGANIGYFTMLSASIVGRHGHVLAVEPNPRNVRYLEASRRINAFDHVTVAQTAAGPDVGLLALHASRSNGTTSNLPENLSEIFGCETVLALPVDRLLRDPGRVHLIKVDVEGAEYRALRGCRELIRRDRPAIVSEFNPDLLPEMSSIGAEGYLRFFVDRDYRLGVIEPDGSITEHGKDTASVLARHKSEGTDHIDILAVPR